MTKSTLLFLLALNLALTVHAQNSVLNRTFIKYAGKWPKTISFTQETTFFRENGVVRQTWYEAGSFPDYFRIDFDRAKGDAVIFNGDEEFYFKVNVLTKKGKNNNPLIYLLGGMYFDSLDTAQAKLSKMGIGIDQQTTSIWKGRKAVVLGAKKGDTTSTQLWFDAKELYLVRYINNENASKLDVHFYGQQKIGSTWHESIVDIFRNGKLVQKEVYRDFKTNIKLDQAIFDPLKFGKVHWLD
jgi:outer membrane lipoprotein-sorting protein